MYEVIQDWNSCTSRKDTAKESPSDRAEDECQKSEAEEAAIDEANMSLAEVPRTLHCFNHRLPFHHHHHHHHHHRGARNYGSSSDRENHESDEEEQGQVVWEGAARSSVDCSQDPHHRNHKGDKTGQQNKETKAGNFPPLFQANLAVVVTVVK